MSLLLHVLLIFGLLFLLISIKDHYLKKNLKKNMDAILSSIISNNENPSDLDLLACQTIFYCKYVYSNPSSTFLFGGRYASVSTIMLLCVQVCEYFLSGSNEPLSAKYKKDYANKVLLGCSSLYGLSFDELEKVYVERLPYLSQKIGTDAQSTSLVAFRRILEVEFYQSGFCSLTSTDTKNYFYNLAAQTNCTNEILSFYRTTFIDNAFCDLDKKLIARIQEQLNDKVIESHNNYEKDTEDIIIQDNDIPSSADFYNTSKQYNSTENNIKTKRNFKKISPRTLFVSVLLLFCFSFVGNIVFFIENHTLKEENNSLYEKYQQAEEDKNEYKQKNFYSEAKLEMISDEYEFYHKYAVITTTTGYRYHKYGCYHLNNDNGFYIFNIENATYQGYTPCLDCLGSGSTEEIKDKLKRELY